MALIANVNRDPKRRRRPYQPREFDPFEIDKRSQSQHIEADIRDLRGLFIQAGFKPTNPQRKEATTA
ncbi:MAG TPA: hypothetical protein VES36_01835 [Candidatus Limnocylindrales bacterium]|nr:hypothetical protein [Candidatus Limnocylindrales bacterium]